MEANPGGKPSGREPPVCRRDDTKPIGRGMTLLRKEANRDCGPGLQQLDERRHGGEAHRHHAAQAQGEAQFDVFEAVRVAIVALDNQIRLELLEALHQARIFPLAEQHQHLVAAHAW